MLKLHHLLTVVTALLSYVNSWDIAITVGDQIEFYTNNTKVDKESIRLLDVTALAYDAVHNVLLYVDRQNDDASIFSYHIPTKKTQPLIRKRESENIQGLAFDPLNGLLFWTDSNKKSIFKTALIPGTGGDADGSLLISMDEEIPRAVAVDSCRGYVYWTNTNTNKPTIERAMFDGSGREVIVDQDIFMPVSITIDQRNAKLYWADDRQGIHYAIVSSDLDGKNRRNLYSGVNHEPNSLTVSKDSIFWTDRAFKTVWEYPKNSTREQEPKELVAYKDEMPFGVVANYHIQDQTDGIVECGSLEALSKNKTAANDTFKGVKGNDVFCIHGEIDGKKCRCSNGYYGENCESSVCLNFCVFGDCSVDAGKPICKCKQGYVGDRCETNLCAGRCLNHGECSVVNNEPMCRCSKEYEGARCENQVKKETRTESCNCTSKLEGSGTEYLGSTDGVFVESCQNNWDSVRDPIIMLLGILCGLLCVACAVLITKVMHLKRRPRIKKRIIVNKNVTPLTARPDQCEITIENCCNMNICETPCFEPRTIRPTLLDVKPGKEEKKNLIANMEHSEDLY